MIRAFVAVELDETLRRAAAEAQAQARQRLLQRLGADARIQWIKPESIHLTLKFLGDIAEERLEAMRQALAGAVGTLPAFAVDVGGLGVFPDVRGPRIFWVGLHERADELSRLAAAVETALEGLGVPRERRPFNAHLTLARIKDQWREVGQALAASGALDGAVTVGRLVVSTISLMQSRLERSGAVYTRVWQVPLRPVE
jgi:2'-5' RNA ligase